MNEIDPGIMRSWVMGAPDDVLIAIGNEIKQALEGDSNDAEHDALFSCAALFGIGIDDEEI